MKIRAAAACFCLGKDASDASISVLRESSESHCRSAGISEPRAAPSASRWQLNGRLLRFPFIKLDGGLSVHPKRGSTDTRNSRTKIAENAEKKSARVLKKDVILSTALRNKMERLKNGTRSEIQEYCRLWRLLKGIDARVSNVGMWQIVCAPQIYSLCPIVRPVLQPILEARGKKKVCVIKF